MSPIKKENLHEPFEAWWRTLTVQGDPLHRYYLIQEAFIAGYAAAQKSIYRNLGDELIARSQVFESR